MALLSKPNPRNPNFDLRPILAEIIEEYKKKNKREQLAMELTAKQGERVTANMLNGYTALSKSSNKFPACMIESFSEITGTDRLQLAVMGPELRRLVELGKCWLALSDRLREFERQRKKGRHGPRSIVL